LLRRGRSQDRVVAVAAILFASALGGGRAEAEPLAPTKTGYLVYPEGPGSGKWRIAAGASMDVLPRRLVEAEQRVLPKLTGAFRIGLPWGFSAGAELSAIVVSNEMRLVLGWAHCIGDVCFDVHDRAGLTYGTIGVQGFDATEWGGVNMPGVSIGVPMGYVRFTIGWEALLVHSQHVKVGDATLSRAALSYQGFQIPLVVENMLGNGGVIYYGVTLLSAQANYQLWLAFSDSDRKQVYPRFLAGYEF
jgi:hypothetical protein